MRVKHIVVFREMPNTLLQSRHIKSFFMAIISKSGKFFTTYQQPNLWAAGFFHDGRTLLRFVNPDEHEFIMNSWGLDAQEVDNDPEIKFYWERDDELYIHYVEIPELQFKEDLGCDWGFHDSEFWNDVRVNRYLRWWGDRNPELKPLFARKSKDGKYELLSRRYESLLQCLSYYELGLLVKAYDGAQGTPRQRLLKAFAGVPEEAMI